MKSMGSINNHYIYEPNERKLSNMENNRSNKYRRSYINMLTNEIT